MRGNAVAEVEVVAARLQRIGHLDVVERPAAGDVEVLPAVAVHLDVVHAVGHPDADVALRLAPHEVRQNVAAVDVLFRQPLQPGEAAYGRVHPAEAVGLEPGEGEGADAPGRLPRHAARISVLAQLHRLLDLRQHLFVEVTAVAVGDGVVLQAAHHVVLALAGEAQRPPFAACPRGDQQVHHGRDALRCTRLSVTVCRRKLIRSRSPTQFCPSCQTISGAPRAASMPALA